MQQQTDFQRKAAPLTDDLLNALEAEHIREVEALYRDQVMYRAELKRVIDVMQQDMLPREKMLHDMLEKLNEAYAKATQHLHQKVGAMASSGKGGSIIDSKKQMMDPLQDMEQELRRMNNLLMKPMAEVKDLTPDQRRSIEQKVASGSFPRNVASPMRQPMPAMTKVYYTQPQETYLPSTMLSSGARSPSSYGSPSGYTAPPPVYTSQFKRDQMPAGYALGGIGGAGYPSMRPGYGSPCSGSAQLRASSAGALSPQWGTPTSQPASPVGSVSPQVGQRLFDYLDANHDGKLTRKEFTEGLRRLM